MILLRYYSGQANSGANAAAALGVCGSEELLTNQKSWDDRDRAHTPNAVASAGLHCSPSTARPERIVYPQTYTLILCTQ